MYVLVALVPICVFFSVSLFRRYKNLIQTVVTVLYVPQGVQMADRNRLVLLALAIAVAVVTSETIVTPIVGLLVLYGLWSVLLRLVVPRSRYVGGIAISVLSAIPLAVGFIASWVGIIGVFLFVHGVWLSVTAAAQLDG